MQQKFTRTEMLIGKDSLKRLKGSTVAVFGVGGVGGFVTEALARGGVGRLILIDFDTISVSNINRQIVALDSTVGKLKVDVMKDRIQDIDSTIEVITCPIKYDETTSQEVFKYDIDYVVDAIDMVSAKLHLIELCKTNNIPIISSMGTGNKLNPTMLEVSDISKTSICPLARVMRRELKKRDIKRLKVVYSKEQPIRREEYMPTDGSRPVPASISFVPSCAGIIIASEVIKDIAGINSSK